MSISGPLPRQSCLGMALPAQCLLDQIKGFDEHAHID